MFSKCNFLAKKLKTFACLHITDFNYATSLQKKYKTKQQKSNCQNLRDSICKIVFNVVSKAPAKELL